MTDRARLRFIAGKGGVGRSTVARSLARRSVSAGRRTLLVEAMAVDPGGDPDRSDDGHDHPDGYRLLRLSTQNAIDEYVRRTLRLPIGPRRLRPLAAIFDYVALAAPGVREILTAGKILHETRLDRWDEIVVDAPASGHVVSLIDAPRRFGEMVGDRGPLADESAWMADLIASEATTIVIVTAPEPVVVSETIELMVRCGDLEPLVEAVVVNRMVPLVGEAGRAEAGRLSSGDTIGQADDPGPGLGPGSGLGAAADLAAAVGNQAEVAMTELLAAAGGRPMVEVAWSIDPADAADAALLPWNDLIVDRRLGDAA